MSGRMLTGGYPGFEQAERHRAGQADLRGQPGQPGPGRRQSAAATSSAATSATRRCSARVLPGHDAVLNFAAETHVDRSIAGAADFVATNVAGVQVLLQACLDANVPPGGPGLHRRGVRQHRDRVLGRGRAAGAELPVLGGQGRRRPDGPGLRPDPRAQRQHHPVLQQLRPLPVPGEGHPAVRDQPAGRAEAVPLYGDGRNVRDWIHVDDHCRGIQLVLERGDAGRDLPHQRRRGADQPRADPGHPGQLQAPTGTW